ncbi:cation:proton antiporter [Dactylosporangium sp. NPDC051541]|uniref:cation:proton antiporter n=1 Tax=Dactylosporangium sp. NPDC051541 TaxID=3363977 RepID=UPI0037ADAC5F
MPTLLTAAPVAPIDAHSLLVFLLQVTVLLGVALLLGRIATRFGMPAVIGELLAGVLLGPSLLEKVAPGFSDWLLPHRPEQVHMLDAVGQVGVLLLIGLTGIELDLPAIRRRGATAIRVSLFGLIIPFGFGVGTGWLLPGSLGTGHGSKLVFALFLGVAMGVSAMPVIAKTLMDMNLLHRNIGQLTLAAGTLDDAFGWFMLSVVSAMAVGGLTAGGVGLSLLYLVGLVVVAYFAGRPAARVLLRFAGRGTDNGPLIGVVVLMIIAGAAATQSLGLEAVLGGFIAGVLIGSAGKVAPARLAPLRTVVAAVFAPLYFGIAGLRMDLTALVHPAVLAAAVVVLAIAILGKFAGAYLGARLSRLNRWEALALGAGMNSRGVVEVIVAMVGLRLGVLSSTTYTIVVLVAIVTSLMAPPILRFAMRRVEHTAEEELRRAERIGDGIVPAPVADAGT